MSPLRIGSGDGESKRVARVRLTTGGQRPAFDVARAATRRIGRIDASEMNRANLPISRKRAMLRELILKIQQASPGARHAIEQRLFCPDHNLSLRVLPHHYACPRIGCRTNIPRPRDSRPLPQPSKSPRSRQKKPLPTPRNGDPSLLPDPILRMAYADMKSRARRSEKDFRVALRAQLGQVPSGAYSRYVAAFKRYDRDELGRQGTNFVECVPKGTIAKARRRAALSGGAVAATAPSKAGDSNSAHPKGWQREGLSGDVRDQLRKAARGFND